MSNPYETPKFESGFGGAGGPDRQAAIDKVKPVALTLIISMALMMVLVVIGIMLNLLGIGLGAAAADSPEGFESMVSGTTGLIQGVMGLAFGGVIIYGSLQMMKLESFGLSMAACIMAMVPCVSPCCCIGLPVGIWGLVVLNDPAVKPFFR